MTGAEARREQAEYVWSKAVNTDSSLEKFGYLKAKVMWRECWAEEELSFLVLFNGDATWELHVQATSPSSCKSPKGFKPSYLYTQIKMPLPWDGSTNTSSTDLEVFVYTHLSSPLLQWKIKNALLNTFPWAVRTEFGAIHTGRPGFKDFLLPF